MSHKELHRSNRVGWLRAAVLGANDGIVSTASLIIGFAAASTTQENILLAGVAGAMSMAAGEYVSVSSQSDTENADLALEKKSLEYEPALAAEVAQQLMAHDALGAHARDEIGISENVNARPVQAALYSAGAFTLGAALPLLVVWLNSGKYLISSVAILSLVFLAFLGGIAARTGGASITIGASRVACLGALAMALTAGVGSLFGVTA